MPVHIGVPLIRTSKVRAWLWTTNVIVDQTPDWSVPQFVLPLGTVWATSVVEPGARCRRIRRRPIEVPAPWKLQMNDAPVAKVSEP